MIPRPDGWGLAAARPEDFPVETTENRIRRMATAFGSTVSTLGVTAKTAAASLADMTRVARQFEDAMRDNLAALLADEIDRKITGTAQLLDEPTGLLDVEDALWDELMHHNCRCEIAPPVEDPKPIVGRLLGYPVVVHPDATRGALAVVDVGVV